MHQVDDEGMPSDPAQRREVFPVAELRGTPLEKGLAQPVARQEQEDPGQQRIVVRRGKDQWVQPQREEKARVIERPGQFQPEGTQPDPALSDGVGGKVQHR